MSAAADALPQLWRFLAHWGPQHQSTVEGVFVAPESDVQKLCGEAVHFGGAVIQVKREHFTSLTRHQAAVAEVKSHAGYGSDGRLTMTGHDDRMYGTISGHNPLQLWEDWDGEDETALG